MLRGPPVSAPGERCHAAVGWMASQLQVDRNLYKTTCTLGSRQEEVEVTAVRSESTRRMPRAQRRAQILDAATRAFARGGFANTGLDAIAAEAGVTPVILYRHFASKADLYREVLESAQNRL